MLVESRFDDLRCPVIFPFVGIPSLADLVPKGSDLARDLVKRARVAVDVTEVRLELDG